MINGNFVVPAQKKKKRFILISIDWLLIGFSILTDMNFLQYGTMMWIKIYPMFIRTLFSGNLP